ncbi:DNA gyrase inhibitor YacG [Pseudoxanthobacter sp.]|uniref:DNA gyrase inhibitor YacG n=1 Tax=Pseudoxanthobacter sp. TaxID=1925742 RepID=UPI002FE11807
MTADETGADAEKRAGTEKTVERRMKPCPICGKMAVKEHHPFCSARCADVDLSRWLSGRYVIAGRPLSAGDDGDAG